MKLIKDIKEQYTYLWWWLLENGLFIATLLVNTFLISVFLFTMSLLYMFVRWYSKHH